MSDEKFQLKEQPFVEFTVRAYQSWNKKERRGISVFKAFPTGVSDNDGKELGSVSGGTGYLSIFVAGPGEHNGEEYLVPHDEIWNALQAARVNSSVEEDQKKPDALGDPVR